MRERERERVSRASRLGSAAGDPVTWALASFFLLSSISFSLHGLVYYGLDKASSRRGVSQDGFLVSGATGAYHSGD